MLNSKNLKGLLIAMNAIESAWSKELFGTEYEKNVCDEIFDVMVRVLKSYGINQLDTLQLARYWDKIETHSFSLESGVIMSGVDLLRNCIDYPQQNNCDNIEPIGNDTVQNTISEYSLSN